MSGVAADTSVFHAIADPTRRALLELLQSGEQSVNELARPFDMTRPAVSQHLRILRDSGLVEPRRVGRETFYGLRPEPIEEVFAWASQFRTFEDAAGHIWRMRRKSHK